MVTKMILISILILAILFATWVKDKEQMNPPLKQRIVIDFTVIGALWLLYGTFILSADPLYMDMAAGVINIGLLYFVAQFIHLIAQISPLFAGLVKLVKKKGYDVPEVEGEEDNESGTTEK